MNKKKKQIYICYDCRNRFLVSYAGHIVLQQQKRNAQCQRCGSKNTYAVGLAEKPKTSLNDKPTIKQLEYIKSLGGNPKRVTTKREASEIINRLKKQ